MPKQIAIFSNTNSSNHHNRKTLELMMLLRKHSPYPVTFNDDYRKLEDSIVIISGYNSKFRNIGKTNKVVFLARSGTLGFKEVLLLPRINVVVAHTRTEAAQLSWQIRHYGYNTKVVVIPPYCKFLNRSVAVNDTTISYSKLDGEYKRALVSMKCVKTEKVDPSVFAHVHLTESKEWPYLVLEAMAVGVPSVINAHHPASEYITHGYNGYIVNDINDVVKAFGNLKFKRNPVSENCYKMAKEFFSPIKYVEAFSEIDKLENFNSFGPVKIEHQNRKWIVREKLIKGHDQVYFPETYDQSIQAIDLAEIIEILDFFSSQLFADVYVFGCELPEWYKSADIIHANSLVAKLGNRARRIHFCRDEEVPHQWAAAFQKLSLISVEEGLKQISNKI
jgi:hypothetical protein